MTIGHLPNEQYVSHYTSIEKALKILEGGEIWLNSVEHVNDPKEYKNWKLNGFYNNNPFSYDQIMDYSAKLSEFSKKVTKIACFSMDSRTNHASGFSRYVDKGCLGRSYANSPMWNFYGDKHKGCCFIFNKKSLERELIDQTYNLYSKYGSIEYIDEKFARDIFNEPYNFNSDKIIEQGFEKYSEDFIYQRADKIYFKKQEDWSYEREYRLLVLSNEEQIFKLKFINSLYGICFGTSCTQKDKELIRSLIKDPHIECSEIYYKNHSIQVVM